MTFMAAVRELMTSRPLERNARPAVVHGRITRDVFMKNTLLL